MSAPASTHPAELTPYERMQFERIAAWKAEHPDVWTEVFRLVALPVARAAEKVIPERLLREAIHNVYKAAERTAFCEDIKRQAGVHDLAELRHGSLEICDRLALQVGRRAQ